MSRIMSAHGISIDKMLQPTSVDIPPGFTAVVGPNGSGKSTLVKTLYGLRHPDQGLVVHYGDNAEVIYAKQPEQPVGMGRRVLNWLTLETPETRREDPYRSTQLAYIGQMPRIPDNLTAEQYIQWAHQLRGNDINPAHLDRITQKLNITRHMGKYATEVSGGELQRIAITYALAHDPRIIVADEPDSALDSESRALTMELLRETIDDPTTNCKAVLCVSHDANTIRNYSDTVISMQDGAIRNVEYGVIPDLWTRSLNSNPDQWRAPN